MARIVYVGLLFDGSTALFRGRSLEELGHAVTFLEAHPPERGLSRVVAGLRRRTGLGPLHAVNRAIVEEVQRSNADVLWVDKGLNVAPWTFAELRRSSPVASVHYSPDDHRIPGNVSKDLLAALADYDVVVTTKSFNVDWLRARGARHVLMSWQGYDPAVHRPPAVGERDAALGGRILLIGAWEEERARTVDALAAAGLPVTVVSRSDRWVEAVRRRPSLEWRRTEVYGRAYACLLGSAAIGLGVLRAAATDLHTSRSIEIPACGTAMLAQRTTEHSQLFEEGVEAEFFADDAECVAKARVLLGHPEQRVRLAERGRRRCIEGRYSWTERVREVLGALCLDSQERGRGG